MHQKYRRGVDLQTVLDNMEALSITEANVQAFTILFKHNQDYVQDIKKLCEMYGASYVYIIKSDRFITTNKFAFINENNEQDLLEAITKDLNHIIKNPWINKATDNAKNRRNLDVMTNNKLTGQQDDKKAYER